MIGHIIRRMRVIGSKINAYINLGFFLNWQLNSQWSLTAGMDFTHYSNGNTHYPNSGVNPIGGRVGIVRTFGDGVTTVQGFKSLSIKPYISYDLVVYGATRKEDSWMAMTFVWYPALLVLLG